MRLSKNLPAVILYLVMVASGCSRSEPAAEVRVGGLFDLTGPTHESCVPYADGIRRYVEFVNEKGGINGRRVRLVDLDYAYLIPRAETAYRKLVQEDKVHVILGWGTGDSERLRPLLARDGIPFMSASYSAKLGVIAEAPYNFLIGVTYSDQMRIVLKYIAERWPDRSRRPRVAFLYNDTEFGRSPIPEGRSYAASRGIKLVAEERLSVGAREAGAQLARIMEKKADYVVMHEQAWAGSVALKDARQMGLKAQFIGLNWCVDEKVVALAGEAAEGYLGVAPFLFADQEVPGIREILAYNRVKGVKTEGYILRYIQGWTTARVMLEGVRRAGDDLSGAGVRKGLESIRGFDTGGITAPITFTPASHVGNDRLKLVAVRGGRWHTVSDFIAAQ